MDNLRHVRRLRGIARLDDGIRISRAGEEETETKTPSCHGIRGASRLDRSRTTRTHARVAARNRQTQGVPAFVILDDSTLEELCRLRPTTADHLLNIRGIGPKKAELYSSEILAAMQDFKGRV
jgi:superfamily II DNA helicase RecQ